MVSSELPEGAGELAPGIDDDGLLDAARLNLRVEISTLVAHDLGNQLTVIHNAARMLRDGPEKIDRNMLDLLLSSSRWALSLSRQLQGLARDEQDKPCDVDCNDLIREQSPTLACVLGDAVTIDFELSPTPVRAEIDESSLREMLLNFALNSRDAMPNGGVFHLSTAFSEPPNGTQMASPCAHLTVRDTGQGMDEETRLQIFEPHFSRKHHGHRSGLGLVSVKRAVLRVHGVIRVESAPGKGTRFDIYLPLCPPLPK